MTAVPTSLYHQARVFIELDGGDDHPHLSIKRANSLFINICKILFVTNYLRTSLDIQQQKCFLH